MVSFNQILRSVAIAAAFVAVTNCSESATSPTGANSLTPSFNRSGPGGHGRADRFLAGVNSGNFNLDGGSYIKFPGGAICQLGVSGYGASYWDMTCNTNKGPVQVNWNSSTTNSGHARFDFEPAMRFSPSSDVELWIYDPTAGPHAVILYCNDANVCVDEGKANPKFITYRDGNWLHRRIGHFSGYAVSGDGNCDPSVDPTCGNQS